MSDELQDEVEAINSIYGEGSLTPADDSASSSASGAHTAAAAAEYILKLPGDASSLRLQFPASYPAQAPKVLGTHHSSGGVRGAGSRDLGLFREVLDSVFQEGVVCLFDAVEEFGRLYEEALEAEEQQQLGEAEAHYDDEEEGNAKRQHEGEDVVDVSSLPAPPWIISEPLVDTKSTFIAHVARVTSTSQARLYVQQLLASDKRIRTATHNMTAWRIRGPGSASFQDCDDDGETAAGGRLLHLMQLMDIWDAMVVVTRWYGGVKLGPRRFAVINAVARDGFVRAGLVADEKKEKDKKKK